jgi:hypothetical protein
MDMPLCKTTQPWILGTLAVYAPSLAIARQVRDLVNADALHDAFGTLTLPDGEEIDWIDMSYQAMLRSHAHNADDRRPWLVPAIPATA